MVSNSPFGIGGPKGMDPAMVKVLHDAFKKGMEEQAYKDMIAKLDMEPYYMSTADYHAYAMQQAIEQEHLVEELGLKTAVAFTSLISRNTALRLLRVSSGG